MYVNAYHKVIDYAEYNYIHATDSPEFNLTLPNNIEYLIVYLKYSLDFDYFAIVDIDPKVNNYAVYYWIDYLTFSNRIVYGWSSKFAIEITPDMFGSFELNFTIIPCYLFKIRNNEIVSTTIEVYAESGTIKILPFELFNETSWYYDPEFATSQIPYAQRYERIVFIDWTRKL